MYNINISKHGLRYVLKRKVLEPSKFKRHIELHAENINFVPMHFNDKKVIFMKPSRIAGTSIWKHTLKNYVIKSGGWDGGQGASNSKDWLNNITDDELINEYFIFTFVRNPFDRDVSFWNWMKKTNKMKVSSSFEIFIKTQVWLHERGFFNPHYYPLSVYCEYNDRKPILDYVGRFENLNEDWKILCGYLSIPDMKLAHTAKGLVEKVPYQNYYTSELVEVVSKLYRRDLELFGYKYDD